MASGGARYLFLWMLKNDLNIADSEDRFFVDFGRFLEGPGKAKTVFSLESGTNFMTTPHPVFKLPLEIKTQPT